MINQLVNIFSSLSSSVFIRYDSKTVTYAEYLKLSATLAKTYFCRKQNPTICVLSKDTIIYFYCFMAALLCSGQIVPVDCEKAEPDIASILDTVNPDFIVSDIPINNREMLNIDINTLVCDDGYSTCLEMLSSVNTEREYLVTFTSGTTAQPKGVVHSFGNLIRSANSLGTLFGFNQDSIFFHNFPVSYMAGILNQFIVPMVFGAQVAVGKRFGVQEALHFWKQPIKYNANVFWMSPTILRLLLSVDRDGEGREYCSKGNITIIVATAPLPVSLRKTFEVAYNLPLYESYGLTETLFNATNHPGKPIQDGCAGSILPGVHAEVAMDEELILVCDWMFLRYFHENQGITKRTDFATGDFVQIEDNNLYITGRKKDLIIRGGMNISPSRIDAELDQFIEVEEYSVIGIPDPILGEKTVIAYVAKKQLEKDDEKEICKRIIAQLGRDYSIDSFIRVPAIPKNANGKTDKNTLKSLVVNKDNAAIRKQSI